MIIVANCPSLCLYHFLNLPAMNEIVCFSHSAYNVGKLFNLEIFYRRKIISQGISFFFFLNVIGSSTVFVCLFLLWTFIFLDNFSIELLTFPYWFPDIHRNKFFFVVFVFWLFSMKILKIVLSHNFISVFSFGFLDFVSYLEKSFSLQEYKKTLSYDFWWSTL